MINVNLDINLLNQSSNLECIQTSWGWSTLNSTLTKQVSLSCVNFHQCSSSLYLCIGMVGSLQDKSTSSGLFSWFIMLPLTWSPFCGRIPPTKLPQHQTEISRVLLKTWRINHLRCEELGDASWGNIWRLGIFNLKTKKTWGIKWSRCVWW